MFEYSTPEAEGISSKKILEWAEKIENCRYVHSFILMRHGRIIAEMWRKPYSKEYPHRLYSTSKSFISCGIGIAAEEGLLSLDDKLVKFFPEKLPVNPDPAMDKITLRHLLSMNSGHAVCQIEEAMDVPGTKDTSDWIDKYLATKLPYTPGTHFAYNSGNTYMLSAILQKVSGMKARDYLMERLFIPLGIENPYWQECPSGRTLGGWGLELTTSQLASFTQMLLNKGRVGNRQIVPEWYIDEATSFQSDNSSNANPDWRIGYGYQFWRSQHNCFRGDGWGGQYAFVCPEHDFTMTITAGLMCDMQQILNFFYEIILPAFHNKSLEADEKAVSELKNYLSSRKIPLASGGLYKRMADTSYDLEDNEYGFKKLSVSFNSDSVTLELESIDGTCEKIKGGFAKHITGELKFIDFKSSTVSSSAAWRDDDTLVISTVWCETPFLTDFILTFKDGDSVILEDRSPIRFRMKHGPVIKGKMVR